MAGKKQSFDIKFVLRQAAVAILVVSVGTPSIAWSAFVSSAPSASVLGAPSAQLMPHDLPGRGPWFEGWYVRVTDPSRKLSFATIATSATSNNDVLWFKQNLPGYAAFLFSSNGIDGGKTRSTEVFPQETKFTFSESDDASDDNAENQNQHFCWSAPDVGSYCDTSLNMNFLNGDEVQVQFGERLPWNSKNPDWGPAGMASYIPGFPLMWYVDSLGTPVKYRVKLGNSGEVITGQGYAHIEKNWGRVFPKAWVWMQGTSPDNGAHLALAGGPLGVGPFTLTSFLVGYKSDKIDLNIHPDQGPQVRYKTHIDAKNGDFSMVAENLRYRLEVKAHADPGSFAPVSIPTEDGYTQAGGEESFVARIEVKAYRDGKLVETRVFEGAALEFGGKFKN